MQETWEIQAQSLGGEDSLKEEMGTHSSILAWRISWTEERGRLCSPWSHKELDTTEHTHHNHAINSFCKEFYLNYSGFYILLSYLILEIYCGSHISFDSHRFFLSFSTYFNIWEVYSMPVHFFFIYLLAICISSLEKLSFNSIAHSKMSLSDLTCLCF